MRETEKQVTASNLSSHLIGYERLLALFKDIQKQTPKGVGLKREVKASGTYILLQFKLGDKRVGKACNCDFTEIGIVKALEKANKVSEALTKFSSETEFCDWYDTAILEKNVVRNDLITFGEAIKLVEENFWNSYTKKRQQRDRKNPSHQSCWYDTYGMFYKLLPPNNTVNYKDIKAVIDSKERGTKVFKLCICAMKKLAEIVDNVKLRDELTKIDATQTKFKENLQSISLDDFLNLRESVITEALNDNRYNIESRQCWLFVFSMQVIYGMRLHEVFAVQNINQPYKTKDGVIIAALNDPNNKEMIAVVGDKTLLGTTTKTGYRLARPMIPPTYPDLIEKLDIKSGKLPTIELNSDNPGFIRKYLSDIARKSLVRWTKDARFTQTHALRHLANLNGMMAGIPLEKRAMSLVDILTVPLGTVILDASPTDANRC